MQVNFLQPTITEEDIEEVARVLRSGWLVLQKETELFEKAFAQYMGAKEAVLVNSCTCALHLSLKILDLKEGDEVITTSLSYVSSVNPVLHCRATPVFVDVVDENGLIDLERIEAAITPKTKGILPVHLYGQMVDMKALKAIADKHNLWILEDAAHAIESERDGVRSGELGFSAAFSFHVAKNITAGTGGVLLTNDAVAADRARILRRDGVRNVGSQRFMEELGHKYLATDFQAAMLRNQLHRIDSQWERRKALYERYKAALDEHGLKYSTVVPGSKHAYHMIVLWVDPERRDAIRDALFEKEIQTSVHYNPIHLEPYYKQKFGFKEGMFPVAEKLGYGSITLPMHTQMTDEQQEFVITNLLEIVQSK